MREIFRTDPDVMDTITSDMDSHIAEYNIAKKSGGTRKIIAPDSKLKYQHNNIYYNILLKYRASKNAHGFVKGRSIVTNARRHVGAKSIGHMDITNFFDTINKDHLKNCLFGNKNVCKMCKHHDRMLDGKCHPSIYRNREVKYIHRCEEMKAIYINGYCEKNDYDSLFKRIISLSTYKNSTPQGFPTSPFLANIVLRGFDKKMDELAERHDCEYTRYADDITVSSKIHRKGELQHIFQKFTYNLLFGFGFTANREKTRWKDSGRLSTCGIVVNKKTNIRRRDVMNFRARVDYATVKNADNVTRETIRKLKGWASFLSSANERMGKKYMRQLKAFERKRWLST